VLDSDGRPLAGVGITAVRSGWTDKQSFYRDHYARLRTEADGSFEFELLAPGSYTLRAPDGFQRDSPPPRIPHGRATLADIEVASSAVYGVELRLPPRAKISGTVVDDRGNPVTGAWVRVLDERGLSLSAEWEAQTDATGHFSIESAAPGPCTVRVRAEERETTSAPFTVEAGKTASVRIEFK
jgi:protocatechuate 3,4-dioxygenase beta subunit